MMNMFKAIFVFVALAACATVPAFPQDAALPGFDPASISADQPVFMPIAEDGESLLAITRFEHEVYGDGRTRVLIAFNLDIPLEVRAFTSPVWPQLNELDRLEDGTWRLDYGPEPSDDDGAFDQYTVLLLINAPNGVRHWVSIHRQSASELLDGFNLVKPDGYSIIAETTLALPGADSQQTVSVVDTYSAALSGPAMVSVPDAMPVEMRDAARVMLYLNREGLTYAPRPAGQTFSNLTDELAALQIGTSGMQCGDYRTIFTHLAEDMGVQVRWVGILSFMPTQTMPDATPYSHAVTEIWTQAHGWVMFDPWMNLSFVRNGEWLSVDEARIALRDYPAEVEWRSVTADRSRTGRYSLQGPLQTFDVGMPNRELYRGYFTVTQNINVEFE